MRNIIKSGFKNAIVHSPIRARGSYRSLLKPSLKTSEVGILGGGQLARMLAQSAVQLGLRPVIYADHPQCPAHDAASDLVLGTLNDSQALEKFFARVSVVIFENEFVDCEKLRSAAIAAGRDPDQLFRPGLSTIRALQNKLQQKKMLAELKIPTSPFIEVSNPADLPKIANAAGGAVVLKWSRLGYDGKGVLFFDPRKEDNLPAALRFCESAHSRGIAVYAEKKIRFKRELAVIAVTGTAQKRGTPATVTYPLVISEQEDGICKRVMGPALALGARPAHQKLAVRAAAQIAKATGLCGAFGIEFFETREGKLLVNEIAPRVHNTGHYTQNAFSASQFENHWRAVLGLDLRDPLKEPGANQRHFAMLNLLGPDQVSISGADLPLPSPGPSSHLHWYGKLEISPRRKLGHLNGIARDGRELKKLLREFELCEKSWIQALKKK